MLPLYLNYNKTFPHGPAERQRHVWVTIAVAMAVSLAVALASAGFILVVVPQQVRDQVTRATARASIHNCLTQHQGRANSNRQRFALREILAFDTDLINASVAREKQRPATANKALKQFIDTQTRRLNKDLAIERGSTPGLPARMSGLADVEPFLADIPQVDCSSAVLLLK